MAEIEPTNNNKNIQDQWLHAADKSSPGVGRLGPIGPSTLQDVQKAANQVVNDYGSPNSGGLQQALCNLYMGTGTTLEGKKTDPKPTADAVVTQLKKLSKDLGTLEKTISKSPDNLYGTDPDGESPSDIKDSFVFGFGLARYSMNNTLTKMQGTNLTQFDKLDDKYPSPSDPLALFSDGLSALTMSIDGLTNGTFTGKSPTYEGMMMKTPLSTDGWNWQPTVYDTTDFKSQTNALKTCFSNNVDTDGTVKPFSQWSSSDQDTYKTNYNNMVNGVFSSNTSITPFIDSDPEESDTTPDGSWATLETLMPTNGKFTNLNAEIKSGKLTQEVDGKISPDYTKKYLSDTFDFFQTCYNYNPYPTSSFLHGDSTFRKQFEEKYHL